MITRKASPKYLSILSQLLLPSTSQSSRLSNPASASYVCRQCRHLHKHVSASKIPQPTPFVPDTPTFLTLIGRELSKHSSKFNSWDELFTLPSAKLREMGIEPARTRRYLLRWREKFRKGEFGIGGDFKYVENGVGELRVVEVPVKKRASDTESSAEVEEEVDTNASATQSPGMVKIIVNVPPGSTSYVLEEGQTTAELKKPYGFRLLRGQAIAGSNAFPVAGSNGSVARLKVQEGLWEHKRGHKVDGGERRKAEVRFKRGVAERAKARL